MDSQNGTCKHNSVIHVLVANLAGVLAEIVERTVQQQPDMRLLGHVERWTGAVALGTETHVLVLGANDVYPPPAACLQMLDLYPHLTLFYHSKQRVFRIEVDPTVWK
jgi:hypothetical protein